MSEHPPPRLTPSGRLRAWWQDLRRRPGPITRLRRGLARLLWAVSRDEAAGGVVLDRFAIDDGVNYDLPLVVPQGLAGEARNRFVAAAVAEADARFHHQFDRPYAYRENLSLFPTADPLREWDFATRKEILARCHMAWERNPLANAAVGLTTLFTVGEGMTVTYRNAQVERVLEEFRGHADNALQEYEKAFCDALQVDGELFVRFHAADGQTVITSVPPWEIDWIETERGFAKRPVAYHRNGEQSNGVPGDSEPLNGDIPAAEVLHVAINRLPYESRGRPDLFRVLPWLKAYKDWLENRARQNHWRGGLLWDVTLAGATPGQVATKRGQYRQPPPPGSLLIHNEKETWAPLQNKADAADVAEDGRQIKLMSAVGMRLPEYFLADGENANLATTQSQQMPALRKFVDFQDVLVAQVWTPIYRRVIENAIAAGLLEETVAEQDADGDPVEGGGTLLAVDAFSVSAPEVTSEDPKTLAEALQIAVNRGWASDETASQRMGFDYRLEQKKIVKELEQDRDRAAQGLVPSGPGFGGAPLPGFPTTDEPTPQGADNGKDQR